MTVESTPSTLPRLARFNGAPASSRPMARASGQPSALFIGTRAGLALALGRLAEIQHLPLTIFWSVQAMAEATLLSADVAILDVPVWQDLQSPRFRALAELLSAMPIVLVVSDEEQTQLPADITERVHLALLPKTHAAVSILQVASRAMKEAAARAAADEAALLATPPLPLKLAPQVEQLQLPVTMAQVFE